MRSVVGKKDVFLSYAHINVQFALEIKVRQPFIDQCIVRFVIAEGIEREELHCVD